MKINRKFKDTVFTTLFSDPDMLRELYCALEGVTLPPDIPVSINTLKNVVYMGKYNDISFEIGGKLVVLIEHQSTINPNMALRFLHYISYVLEAMFKGKNVFTGKRLSIPWPEFFVLYNGTSSFSDEQVIKLSDLFEKPQSLGLPEKAYPLLELEAKVINITEGRNENIQKRCRKLYEYGVFISKVHEYWRIHGNLKKGINETVKYCIKHDILKEFLEKHGGKVMSMLYEWNLRKAKKVWREEAREEGHKEGHEEGRKEGHEEGLEKGMEEGRITERQRILELLDQGLSVEEMKKLLKQ